MEIAQAEVGMVLDFGDGSQIEILTVNNNGMVLLLTWYDFFALLPMDMDFDNLDDLKDIPNLTNISVYLLPDSGYSPLSPPEWINRLSPNLAILSGSASDSDGFPYFDTMSILESTPTFRTDQCGWIEVTTDGHQMWVEIGH